MINILVITTWFPNEININTGIFVKKLIEAQIKYSSVSITVVSPIPYFPKLNFSFIPEKYRNASKVKYCNDKNGYLVYYPRYFKLPSPYSEKVDWYSYFKAVKKTIKKEKIKFDIIHSHGLIPDAFVATKISKLFNKPIVNHIHDTYFDEIYKKNKIKVDEIFEHSKRIIPVSHFQANIILKYYNRYFEKIEVVYNGVDTEKFKYNVQNIEINNPLNKFIFVGVIDHRKGIDLLIESFNILKDLSITLDIYGKGKQIQEYQKQIDLYSLNEKIKFKGEIDNNLLGSELSAHSFFIFPSRYETFGIVLIEAMACGLPVIASNITAIPEIVQNEEIGILFESENYLSLSEAIKKAINKKWNKKYIREQAERFSMKVSVDNIDKIYNNIIENNN